MRPKLLIVALLCLTLTSCDQGEKSSSSNSSSYDADNTGKNVRDKNGNLPTPLDQSETESDRRITQKIRQALINDDSLSTNAKNVKIVTNNGIVTLRGPVGSEKEKSDIGKIAKNFDGVKSVDNQLDVSRK